MNHAKATITALVAMMLGFSIASYAGPKENFEKAQVFLMKARASSAVKVKVENLKNARDLITISKYTKGGHGAAAITLIMQAIKHVNEFRLDRANVMIDSASVKVKHAIQAIKQEEAARAAAAGK